MHQPVEQYRRAAATLFSLVLLSTLSLLLVPLASASTGVGYLDFSWNAPGIGNPTAEKPQSKLWFNDGVWWGVLFNSAAGNYHIYRFDVATHTWSDTGTLVDDRNNSHADALWDGSHLYIASGSTNGLARLLRFSYDPVVKKYSRDAGYPVNVSHSGMESVVLAKDSTGQLWITYTAGSQVYVNRSTGNDRTWGTSFVLPVMGTAVSSDDISAVIAFDGDKIGVMWSNQLDDAMYFAEHHDGDPDDVWQASRTAVQGPKSSDDHINLTQLAADSSGRVFAVVKTSLDELPNPNPNAPMVMVLILDTNDNWNSHTFGRIADDHTRPIAVIDDEHRMLYVFAATSTGAEPIGSANALTAIYYKSTSLDNISFAAGKGTPFIEHITYNHINDPSSTKQTVNSTTGLLVQAADIRDRLYFHNYLDLGGTQPTATPTETATLTPTLTPSPSPTLEPTPTETPTEAPTSTPTPTETPTEAPTEAPTSTPTPTDTGEPTYSEEVMADSPVSYWRLNDATSAVVMDSADGNTGTSKGKLTAGVAGILASDPAILFNGTDYIKVSDNSNLNFTGDFTVEAWANLASLDGALRVVVHKANSGNLKGWQYRMAVTADNQWQGTVYIGGQAFDITHPGTPSLNGWDHLVMVREGTTLTLYVNGTAVSSSISGALNTSNGSLAIGRTSSFSSDYFIGVLDEIAVYDRALAAQRVLAHFEAGQRGQ